MPLQKIYTHYLNNKPMSLYIKKDDGLLSTCDIFEKRETALLGISMGNSYFTNERMHTIFAGFASTFKNVAVLLADDLAIHNYRAMGYDEDRIKRKIRENTNHTRNKIKKTIQEISSSNIDFYQWKDIEAYDEYHRSLEIVTNFYYNDTFFFKEINQIILNVMGAYISENMDHKSVINEAKWYFLKELSFIKSSSNFFGTSVVSGYYQNFPLFNRTILSELKNVSFVTYECKEE